MDNEKYILWIAEKKGPINKTEFIERKYEIKTVYEMRDIISCARDSLFLYLGPYELGELYGRTNKALSFLSFMGITNNYGFSVEFFEEAMKQPISLQKLFQTIIPQYELKIAENAEMAWELLQDNWNSVYRVASFVNPFLMGKKSLIDDKSIFFIKKKM